MIGERTMITKQQMIDAIRNDVLVGRNTCTCVDECMSDAELIDELEQWSCTTMHDAIEMARDIEELQLEAACNARWGNDDDPQLVRMQQWRRDRKKHS